MSAKPPTPPSFPSHTPHSVLPFRSPPSMDPSHTRYPSTCIPSLMPPGVDPTSVDFRTFFPYIPNEVKHRKRTSRHQLKVLEDIFRKDTKPNAVLRKKLAAELEMSPRAVQVRPASLPVDACSRASFRSGSRTGTFHALSPAPSLTRYSQACKGKSPPQTRCCRLRPGQTRLPIHEKVSAAQRHLSKRLFQLVHRHREAASSCRRRHLVWSTSRRVLSCAQALLLPSAPPWCAVLGVDRFLRHACRHSTSRPTARHQRSRCRPVQHATRFLADHALTAAHGAKFDTTPGPLS